MKKFLTFNWFFLIVIGVFGQIPPGYYDSAEGLTGYDLKTALHNIIKNPNVDSYSGLWSDFYKTDVDKYYENDGTVLDIYSEDPSGADPYEFTLGDDQCGSYSGEGSCYNREHSFPKSWFNDASPMYSDLFHIYPTDGYVNNKRSNYPYGEVDNPTWTSMNGCKLGPCSIPGYSGTVFEPIDEFKGDLARSYFYMATCYEDKVASWTSDVLDGSSDKVYVDWFLNMLIQWHEQDPVSQKEIDRNDSIYAIQGNRNPFIDHPEWVECIWQNSCSGTVAPPENFIATAVSSSEIDLSWDLNADNDSVVLAYNTTNTFGTPSGNYNPGDNISGGGTVLYVGTATNFNHTGLTSQTYYYKIWSVNTQDYSTGVETSASPLLPEPTNHVTDFIVSATTSSSIDLTWTDATGGTEPTGYLIKANLQGNPISDPVDGNPEPDGTYTKNVAQGVQTVTFDGLNASTTYDFKIFPYTNSGSNIDYKTDGTVPTATGTTDSISQSDTCGHETFDNLATGSSSYSDRSWTGQDGSTWTATDARTDQEITSGNAAICIRNGYIQSGTISGGIGNITMTTKRVFSGGSGNLTVYVNDVEVGTIPYSDAVQTSSIENIDVSGDIVIKIVSDNSDRIVVDDIIWTCNSCSNYPTPPDNVSVSSSDICPGDNVTLSYTGGSGDVFNWYAASCGGTYVGTGDNLTVTPSETTTYYGRWENSCGESACLSVTVNVNQATQITTQPQSQSVCEGDDVTFSVSATGDNLTYQWQKDGSDISGSTSSSLTLTNVSSSDEGSYACVVTGDCGSVTSNAATLTIGSEITITQQPQSVTTYLLDTVMFVVTASGNVDFYQWYKDSIALPSSNNDTLYLYNVQWDDAGYYYCVLSNSCDTVTSDTAMLTIRPEDIQKINQSISIMPNPNDGHFTLFVPYQNAKIMIYDINGQKVYEKICNFNENEIALDNLSSGFYFIKLEGENHLFFTKLIIEK